MTQSAFIILAGGAGERFGSDKPKQLAMLAGKSILEHTIENVASCKSVKQIVVVSRGDINDEVKSIASAITHVPVKIVEGGSSRLESTKAGLLAVEGPVATTKVLVHDGVRPFLSHDVINDCYDGLDKYDAVDVVISSADTLVRVSDSTPGTIGDIPPRENFRRGQTPQGFWLGDILQVIKELPDLIKSNFTDDCGLYLAARPEAKIGLIQGSESNIKVTHAIDLRIAEQLMLSGQAKDPAKNDDINLSSLNILIFGASSGLGEHLSARLQSLGAKVHGASRTTGCDIGITNDVSKTLEAASENGKIDAVINFSGVLHIGKLAEMAQDELDQVVQTNYVGALNIARLSHKYLKHSRGQLLLVSSSSYYRGRKDYAAYSSSKAAVVNLTQALAEESAPDNIRVNCIVPRRANTPMRRAAFPLEDSKLLIHPNDVSLGVLELLKTSTSGMISHVS